MLADVVKSFDSVVFLANHQKSLRARLLPFASHGLGSRLLCQGNKPSSTCLPILRRNRDGSGNLGTRVPCRLIRPRFDLIISDIQYLLRFRRSVHRTARLGRLVDFRVGPSKLIKDARSSVTADCLATIWAIQAKAVALLVSSVLQYDIDPVV